MGILSTISSCNLQDKWLTLRSDLPAAIRRSESLRKTQNPWPPADTGEDPSSKGLMGVMDDEMGFVD